MTQQLAVVDVGGTHARFAIAEVACDGSVLLSSETTVLTSDHDTFGSAWAYFRNVCGGTLPRAASLAVAATSLDEDRIVFTNNDWTIERAKLPALLDAPHCLVLNDFAAIAHSVAGSDNGVLRHLAGPDRPLPVGMPVTVVGPGTGLGVAHYLRDARGAVRVTATQGGHVGFAPNDAFEDALLSALRAQFGRVSVERLVSGPGIVTIHRVLDRDNRSSLEDDVAIWSAGISGSDPIAVEAVSRFCSLLGAVAGDLALAHGSGGVVLAGGLGYRLRNILPQSDFVRRLQDKGRFGEVMQNLPVKLVLDPQPGLRGAARAFVDRYGKQPMR